MTDIDQWRLTYIFFSKRDAEGNAVKWPMCMSRYINGAWEYRNMTEEEEADWVSEDAW